MNYDAWLINWRDDFEESITELRELFNEKYEEKILKEDSKFNIQLKEVFENEKFEQYNLLKILSEDIKKEFDVSSKALLECFGENISWTLRNFSLVCFTDRVVQTYAFLSFFEKTAELGRLSQCEMADIETVSENFFNNETKYDLISLRRMVSVVVNPFDHFTPSKNFSKSSNFYIPDFTMPENKTFVKDSMQIQKFDFKGVVPYKNKDSFEVQVLSVFKTCYTILGILINKFATNI